MAAERKAAASEALDPRAKMIAARLQRKYLQSGPAGVIVAAAKEINACAIALEAAERFLIGFEDCENEEDRPACLPAVREVIQIARAA